MYLCSDDHEEIAHENRDCPLCEMRDELQDELKTHVKESDDTIKDLEDEIKEYLEQLGKFEDVHDYIRTQYPDAVL